MDPILETVKSVIARETENTQLAVSILKDQLDKHGESMETAQAAGYVKGRTELLAILAT